MDFPSLIKQTGKMDIDIMLVPGSDWNEISPYHTFVASVRGIENGFNMVRSTFNGFSASFNYKGQLLSSNDFFKTNEVILYSDVPVKGQRTVYSLLGDYFAWLCIAFFVSISVLFIKRKRIKHYSLSDRTKCPSDEIKLDYINLIHSYSQSFFVLKNHRIYKESCTFVK